MNAPERKKWSRAFILEVVLRTLGVGTMLVIGTVLALLSHHFFQRGGAILAAPAACAFISAAMLALARNRKVLQFGALLCVVTIGAFVYLGIHG